MRLAVVLLLAAVGLLIAALSTDRAALAWGSVALSVVAAAIIIWRWRRSWLQRRDEPEDEPVLLADEPMAGAQESDAALASASVTAVQQHGEVQAGQVHSSETQVGEIQTDTTEGPPGEEDTDAADLLVVYELTDEVLVVDEHPRYHLARCPWPDQERAERLPLREARELGFTPCDRCRPDKALARKHRATGATTTGS
ncbi:MAG: hypothetical protein ACRDRA_16850 [Pseudonocardiaceae bacterium]